MNKISLLLLIFIISLFQGCSCSSKNEPTLEMIAMKEIQESEFRTESGFREIRSYGKKDVKFRGKKIPKGKINKFHEDGKRALKSKYFRMGVIAVNKNDYREAEKNLSMALANMPSNEYAKRWSKRVKLYKDSDEADKNSKINAARKLIIDAEPTGVLSALQGLESSDNLFIRKKVFYYRSQANEMLGKDEEAFAEKLVWLSTKEKIGELDAESYTLPVDTNE